MNIKKYQAIKSRVEDLEKKIARAEGQLQELLKGLMDDYDVDDEAKAKELIDQLERDETRLVKEIEKLEGAFDKKWGHVLEDLE